MSDKGTDTGALNNLYTVRQVAELLGYIRKTGICIESARQTAIYKNWTFHPI